MVFAKYEKVLHSSLIQILKYKAPGFHTLHHKSLTLISFPSPLLRALYISMLHGFVCMKLRRLSHLSRLVGNFNAFI